MSPKAPAAAAAPDDKPADVAAPETASAEALAESGAVTIPQDEFNALKDRLAELEAEVKLQGLEVGNVQSASDAQSVPLTEKYRCTDCGTVVEAVHRSRWYPAYGAIECPNHPSRPELMQSLEGAAAAARDAALGTPARAVVIPPPSIVKHGAGDPEGELPPPPPLTTLPPTIVSGDNEAYHEGYVGTGAVSTTLPEIEPGIVTTDDVAGPAEGTPANPEVPGPADVTTPEGEAPAADDGKDAGADPADGDGTPLDSREDDYPF